MTAASLLLQPESCSCLRQIPEIVLQCWYCSSLSSHSHVLCTCMCTYTMLIMLSGATVTGSTMTVEGCGSESLQGDVRFAEVMGLMGAQVQWHPYSITITGVPLHGWSSFALQSCSDIPGYRLRGHLLPLYTLTITCSWSSAAMLSKWQLPKQAVHKCTMLACCWTCACASCCVLPS